MKALRTLPLLILLSACATAPSVVDPVPTVDASPPEAEPTVIPTVQEIEEPPGPVVRNQGWGPYDSLSLICGASSERCAMSAATPVSGSATILAAASFFEQPSDGMAYLALQTREGWFVSEIPDGEPFGGGLSHHSPASTHFDLEKVRAEGSGITVLRRHASSSFMPGRGALGSSSRESIERFSCRVEKGRVRCGEPVLVFSRSCSASPDSPERDCKTVGTMP